MPQGPRPRILLRNSMLTIGRPVAMAIAVPSPLMGEGMRVLKSKPVKLRLKRFDRPLDNTIALALKK